MHELNTILHELLDGVIHPNRRGELHDMVDRAVPVPQAEAPATNTAPATVTAVPDVPAGD
jgi:hypothetical protein